jgi:hypothetical protein
MLLKEVKTGSKYTAHYNSSNILKSIFESHNNRLLLYFKSGFIYEYTNVNPAEYVQFRTNESQGKVFHKLIKTKPNKRLDNYQLKDVISEIKNILYG